MTGFNDIREIATLSRQKFETKCKENIFSAYLGDHLAICRILTKYKLYVDTRDMGIAPHLMMDGYWESWLTQCLARIIQPGSVCIDIGANLGYYSLLMSELAGDKGRTVSVEPNPHVCKLLRFSEFLHSWNFDVVEKAVSDTEGHAVLTIPGKSFGGASLKSEPGSPFSATSQVKVATTTVDCIVKDLKLSRVDVIKVDVEGLEPLVFEGMRETINSNPQLQVVIEYSPFSYDDPSRFSDFLIENFIIHRIKDVDNMETLDAEGMNKLLQLTDHTDLYLTRKR